MLSNFIVSDNYDHHPEAVFDFGEYNQYAYEELKEVLKTGTNIHFSYFAIDESMNKTAVFQAVIEVIDTIKPSVKVSDVTVDDVDYNSNDFEQLVIILNILVDWKKNIISMMYWSIKNNLMKQC